MKAIRILGNMKIIIAVVTFCVPSIVAILGYYYIRYGKIVLDGPWMRVEHIVDINDPKALAGLVDSVFVGRVDNRRRVKYEDMGSPVTGYDVTVLENLKGNLKTEETVVVYKDGGISLDRAALILEEGDFLPEEGDICVFFVSVQKDGRLLIAGKNCNEKITEKEFVKSSVYQRIAEACKNEIPFERERNTIPPELTEANP